MVDTQGKDLRFYVFILDTLSSSHQACQGGHAVAEYLLNKKTNWNNGNMIYLRASAEDLDLLTLDPEAVSFREEDFGNQWFDYQSRVVPASLFH